MFKAAPNPYDEIVGEFASSNCLTSTDIAYKNSTYRLFLLLWKSDAVKATDDHQTSENWEVIISLCDKVIDEGEAG